MAVVADRQVTTHLSSSRCSRRLPGEIRLALAARRRRGTPKCRSCIAAGARFSTRVDQLNALGDAKQPAGIDEFHDCRRCSRARHVKGAFAERSVQAPVPATRAVQLGGERVPVEPSAQPGFGVVNAAVRETTKPVAVKWVVRRSRAQVVHRTTTVSPGSRVFVGGAVAGSRVPRLRRKVSNSRPGGCSPAWFMAGTMGRRSRWMPGPGAVCFSGTG